MDDLDREKHVARLIYVAKELRFAHRHGAGLQGWHDLHDKLEAALAPFSEGEPE